MRGDLDFPHANCLPVLFFQQKVDSFEIPPTKFTVVF